MIILGVGNGTSRTCKNIFCKLLQGTEEAKQCFLLYYGMFFAQERSYYYGTFFIISILNEKVKGLIFPLQPYNPRNNTSLWACIILSPSWGAASRHCGELLDFSGGSEPAAVPAHGDEELAAVNGFSSAKIMGSCIPLFLISPLRAICSN